MMKGFLWGCCLFAPMLAAQPVVYQCEVRGVTSYSQFPCATSAKALEIVPGQPTETDPAVQRLQQLQRRLTYLEYRSKQRDSEYQQALQQLLQQQKQQLKLSSVNPQAQVTAQHLRQLQQRYQHDVQQMEQERLDLLQQLQQRELP